MSTNPSGRPGARPPVDPITVEVISNAFSSIVEEMGETLVRASYSTNIKERRDSSTALFDARGRTLAQAKHIPIHLGSLMGIIEAVLQRFPPDAIASGDTFVGNDAYTGGGTHLPDIVLATPVFHGGQLVGWRPTWPTMPTSSIAATPTYQEGLRIPPVRLYRQGVLQEDILELILLNCQVPTERRADLRAQRAANRLGVQRLQALCDRYGRDLVLAAGDALLDYAERKTRAGITRDPRWGLRVRGSLDNEEFEGELTLRVRIEVRGEELWLDFADNPPQVRAGLNMVWTALLATVYYAVKTVVDPKILPNAGLFRPIHVCAPPGHDPQLRRAGGGQQPHLDLPARR